MLVGDTEVAGIELRTFRTFAHNGIEYVRAELQPEPTGRVHVACVFNGKELQLYVAGKLAARTDFTGKYNRSRLPFAIGHSPPGGFNFAGRIHEVRISKVVRYAPKGFEPKDRFTADKDTVALYHFDQGAGNILIDWSGNGHHGRIHGARWVREK